MWRTEHFMDTTRSLHAVCRQNCSNLYISLKSLRTIHHHFVLCHELHDKWQLSLIFFQPDYKACTVNYIQSVVYTCKATWMWILICDIESCSITEELYKLNILPPVWWLRIISVFWMCFWVIVIKIWRDSNRLYFYFYFQ